MIKAINRIKWDEMNKQEARWWPFVAKADDDRLARMVAKHRMDKTTFCPVDCVYNFFVRFHCEDSQKIISRLNRIYRAATLYVQNPNL